VVLEEHRDVTKEVLPSTVQLSACTRYYNTKIFTAQINILQKANTFLGCITVTLSWRSAFCLNQ